MTAPTTQNGRAQSNGRATDAAIVERVSTVLDLLLAGAARKDVLRYVAEESRWGVSERTVDEYMARATAELEKLAQVDRKEAFGTAIARLNQLYNKALAIQDYRAALAVQKELQRLQGL